MNDHGRWTVLRYLTYFSQVGMTVIVPPILFCFGALWLERRFGLGNWVAIVAVLLGVAVGLWGLRDLVRVFETRARTRSQEEDVRR